MLSVHAGIMSHGPQRSESPWDCMSEGNSGEALEVVLEPSLLTRDGDRPQRFLAAKRDGVSLAAGGIAEIARAGRALRRRGPRIAPRCASGPAWLAHRGRRTFDAFCCEADPKSRPVTA